MKLALGRRLKIRTLVHVAGEPIPYFWPMRTFIHHNPLYGLEHLPFDEAVAVGERLFHARGFLPRALQQRALDAGKADRAALEAQVARFVAGQPDLGGLDLQRLLTTLLTEIDEPVGAPPALADAIDVHAALNGFALPAREIGGAALVAQVGTDMPPGRPLYAIVDMLFGSEIGATLDELVIKSCLDFFDEGQSVWQMPGREQGLFAAWSAVARRNLRLFIRGLHIKRILAVDDTPEGIISHVMDELGVPEDDWMGHFTCELTRLHGWAGFIRWRAGAKRYHWARHYPADLVDYLAIRLVLGLALLREHAERRGTPANLADLARFVESNPAEAYLRREFHGGRVLPEMAHAVEDAIAARRPAGIARLLPQYLARKRGHEARRHAGALRQLAARAGQADALVRLTPDEVARLTAMLARFEREEGPMWLAALETHYMGRLLCGLDLAPAA
ncbi:MAG TPA: putative inorganic carbon transporter subunit DabA, partial [Steroidobacteraceae bacterium]|nr:putative inorganic carbon transporter subunit DabA [Steroidobacteraceae bacterium]